MIPFQSVAEGSDCMCLQCHNSYVICQLWVLMSQLLASVSKYNYADFSIDVIVSCQCLLWCHKTITSFRSVPGHGKAQLPSGFRSMFWKIVNLLNDRFVGVVKTNTTELKKFWQQCINYHVTKMTTEIIITSKTMADAAEIVWNDNQEVYDAMEYHGKSRTTESRVQWTVSLCITFAHAIVINVMARTN